MPLLRDQQSKDLLTRYSSFTMVENTLSDVVTLLLKNERLKRLLYYTDPKALHLPKLTNEQTLTVMENQIRIVPKLNVEENVKPYVIVTMDNFMPSDSHTSFRSATLGVDIICPYSFWNLENFKLRPYAIAGEIDAMINKSTITGLGIAQFDGGKMLLISPDIGGVSLYYTVEAFKDDITLNSEEK